MSNRLIVIVAIVLVVIAGSAYLLTKNSSTTLPAATPTPTQAMMDITETPSASPSAPENSESPINTKGTSTIATTINKRIKLILDVFNPNHSFFFVFNQ